MKATPKLNMQLSKVIAALVQLGHYSAEITIPEKENGHCARVSNLPSNSKWTYVFVWDDGGPVQYYISNSHQFEGLCKTSSVRRDVMQK